MSRAVSAAPLPVCERDPFCCAPPGHDGDCDQPFETEYRVGACTPMPAFWRLIVEELRNPTIFAPIDPSTVTQGEMFS